VVLHHRHLSNVYALHKAANEVTWLDNCNKFYFTFGFKICLPDIWERPNTHLLFIKLVESEYR